MSNICTYRTTGTGVLAATLSPQRAFQLIEFRVHLNAVGTSGTLTLSLDSDAGTEYDLDIRNVDMAAVKDYTFQPDNPMHFDALDKLKLNWANANGKTYGIEIKYSSM